LLLQKCGGKIITFAIIAADCESSGLDSGPFAVVDGIEPVNPDIFTSADSAANPKTLSEFFAQGFFHWFPLKKVDGIVFPFFGFFLGPCRAVGVVLGMGFEDERPENVQGDFLPGLDGADEFVGLKLQG
jgi:hypothetical protein